MEEEVGQILPVILDARGRVVDGLHRKEAAPSWREEVRPEIKTEEDYWKARAHLNYARRNAQEAKEEKLKIINSLAEYYKKQGLQVYGEKPDSAGYGGGSASGKNEVVDAVIKALDGAIPATYIRQNIDSKYVQGQKPREPTYNYSPETFKPIDALERDKATVERRYGPDFVERLKEEIIEEALQNPEVIERVIRKPEVAHRAIEKVYGIAPPVVEPRTEEVEWNSTAEQIKKIEEAHRKAQEDLQKRRSSPDSRVKGTLEFHSSVSVFPNLNNSLTPRYPALSHSLVTTS